MRTSVLTYTHSREKNIRLHYTIWYYSTGSKPNQFWERQLSENLRAFCEECVIYMYRMCDDSEKRSRLEEDLGLAYLSRYILGDTNVISCKKSMPCVSLREIAKRYLEN